MYVRRTTIHVQLQPRLRCFRDERIRGRGGGKKINLEGEILFPFNLANRLRIAKVELWFLDLSSSATDEPTPQSNTTAIKKRRAHILL